MAFTFEQAKTLLAECERSELCDHAFGDKEVYFTKDGKKVAEGYCGTSTDTITLIHEDESTDTFTGSQAFALMLLGTLAGVERNDSAGPDEFTQGKCMAGLTKEAVLDELVNK